MEKIQPGDQVVSMAPNGETIEVYSVVKILADGVQVDGTSGRLSKTELRRYNAETVNGIREKEKQLREIRRDIRALYDVLPGIE